LSGNSDGPTPIELAAPTEPIRSMSISNELSSDIAEALFGGGDKSAQEIEDLKKLASRVRATLEELDREVRAARERRINVKEERISETKSPD